MRHGLLIGVLAIALAACGTKETLIAKSAVVPPAVDFAGQWRLLRGGGDSNQRLRDAEVVAAGGEEDLLKTSKRRNKPRRRRGSAVHVFIRTGTNLKITQTDFALFVSFDRSVVEEYRFGEYRSVSVGPIEASRVSGWDGDAYVIETLDDDGNKLVESYVLSADGKVLLRQLSVFNKSELDTSVVQRYKRL